VAKCDILVELAMEGPGDIPMEVTIRITDTGEATRVHGPPDSWDPGEEPAWEFVSIEDADTGDDLLTGADEDWLESLRAPDGRLDTEVIEALE
jgi:hypothetical protein